MGKRARQTQADQMRRLFELYEQKMYRVAFAILRDEGRAEDAVMDAFEKVLRRSLDCDPQSSEAKGLMLSAVKSASIDLYRRQARERRAATYPGDDSIGRMADAANEAVLAESGEDLIGRLPDRYREVLHDRFVEGRSVAETADNLGITQANVRKRQQRAIEALRRQMGATNG